MLLFTNTKAYALDIKIEDVSIIDKSSTVTTDTINYSDTEISSNVSFNEVDDYVTYEIKIKNNENKLFKIKSITDNNTNDNLVIEYENESEINANSSTIVKLTMTYKNKLVNKNISLNNLVITLNLEDENGTTKSVVLNNPKTGDNIINYLALLFVTLFSVYFIKAKKRLKHFKVGNILLLICILCVPFITFAVENYKFSFKFTDVVINGEFEVYDINIVDQGTTTTIQRTYGEKLGTLPNTSKVGNTFDGWYSNNTLVDENTIVTGPMTIESKFTPIKYTLTINDSDYVETSTPSGKYNYGTEITLKAKDRLGYTFTKWSNNNTNTEITFNITSDIEIGPMYEQDIYTVTFDSKGGSDVSNITRTYNQTIGSLETPTRENYTFDGWYTEEENGEKITADTKVTGDITYYAHWTYSGFPTVFSHEGACTFNAYDNITGDECQEYWDTNYIDTGIALFSEENYQKDFEAGFTIESFNPNGQTNEKNQVFMSDKKETGGTAIVQGIVARRSTQPNTAVDISFARNGNKTGVDIPATQVQVVKMFRIDGNIYYSVNNGELILLNSNIQSVSDTFDVPLSFGAGLTVSGSILRPVKATLSNMYVKLGKLELDNYYKMTFNGNGGSLTTTSKSVLKGNPIGNFPNATRSKYYNAGWTTELNGSTYVDTDYVPTGNETFYVTWKYAVDALNVSNSTINLNVGETETIVITNPEIVEEEYYFVSNNTSRVTIDENGVVTAVSSGTATVAIRGRTSGKSKNITININ